VETRVASRIIPVTSMAWEQTTMINYDKVVLGKLFFSFFSFH